MLGFRYINDKTLIQLIKTGNEEALTILYNLTYAPVKKYILRKKGRISDAEEQLTEALLTTWQHVIRNKNTPDLSLKLYVIAIAQNRWNKRKKRKIRKTTELVEQPASPVDKERLSEALRLLSETERRLLFLFYFDGYGARDIATLLGLSSAEEVRLKKSEILKKLSDILNVK
jgi:RNA polymerase sigma factor (sigma-70 family)